MTKSFREAVLTFEFRPVEIPRPKCHGLEYVDFFKIWEHFFGSIVNESSDFRFVPTRGRQGFYKVSFNKEKLFESMNQTNLNNWSAMQ